MRINRCHDCKFDDHAKILTPIPQGTKSHQNPSETWCFRALVAGKCFSDALNLKYYLPHSYIGHIV